MPHSPRPLGNGGSAGRHAWAWSLAFQQPHLARPRVNKDGRRGCQARSRSSPRGGKGGWPREEEAGRRTYGNLLLSGRGAGLISKVGARRGSTTTGVLGRPYCQCAGYQPACARGARLALELPARWTWRGTEWGQGCSINSLRGLPCGFSCCY